MLFGPSDGLPGRGGWGIAMGRGYLGWGVGSVLKGVSGLGTIQTKSERLTDCALLREHLRPLTTGLHRHRGCFSPRVALNLPCGLSSLSWSRTRLDSLPSDQCSPRFLGSDTVRSPALGVQLYPSQVAQPEVQCFRVRALQPWVSWATSATLGYLCRRHTHLRIQARAYWGPVSTGKTPGCI